MAMQPPPPPAAPYAPQYVPPPAAPYAPQYVPPPAASGYAGFWIRVVAYIIDGIITGAIVFGLIKATGVITVLCPAGINDASNPACGSAQISPLFYVFVAIPVVYFILLWAVGGTLGQRALGMRVVNATNGANLGLGKSILRYLGFIISVIPIYLGLIWIGFDSRKQGWHDKIAGSFVVRGGSSG